MLLRHLPAGKRAHRA